MILGMDWIDMVAPVILHTRPHSLSFMTDGRMITLYGVTEEFEVIAVDTKTLKRMLQSGTCEVVAELAMIQEEKATKEQKAVHPEISKLLEQHVSIFQEPKELPQEKRVIILST